MALLRERRRQAGMHPVQHLVFDLRDPDTVAAITGEAERAAEASATSDARDVMTRLAALRDPRFTMGAIRWKA
jgi:hypothetical protein